MSFLAEAPGQPAVFPAAGKAEQDSAARRAALVERWLELTRRILPAMAAGEGWPIRADHCFMRVCLDTAVGRPWPEVVKAPAICNLSDPQLAAAVAVAETIAAHPQMLPGLNAESIARRKAARQGAGLR